MANRCIMCGEESGADQSGHKDGAGLTLHPQCGAAGGSVPWIGLSCMQGNNALNREGNLVKCTFCLNPLTKAQVENWVTGLQGQEKELGKKELERANMWFLEINKPPSSNQLIVDANQRVFDPTLGWQGYVPCRTPNCSAYLSVDTGCDLVTCPGCNKQQNIIMGDKSHTFKVEPFLNAIKKFSKQDGFKAWTITKKQHPQVWAAFHLEDLLQRLAQAQKAGDAKLVTDLVERVSPDWNGFREYLAKHFRPRQDTAKSVQPSPSVSVAVTPLQPSTAKAQKPQSVKGGVTPPTRVQPVLPPAPVRPSPPVVQGEVPRASFRDRLAFWHGLETKKPKVVNCVTLKKSK